MKSNKELINALRAAPAPWMDAAIVVAFKNRFEFVAENDPYPISRLNFQKQGGPRYRVSGSQVEWIWRSRFHCSQLLSHFAQTDQSVSASVLLDALPCIDF
jgi:hypothetical protein